MSERPNLSKGSPTAGASTPATPPPPRFVRIAAVLLGLAGVMAVVTGAALYLGSVKSSIRDGARDAIANQMSDSFRTAKSAGPTGGDRAADYTALRSQITQLKATASDRLTPVATRIKSDVATIKKGASSKGTSALADIDKQADSARNLNTNITTYQRQVLISSVVVLIALGVAARAALRGRYWARWAVLGLWVLATFTGNVAGINSVLSIAGASPAIYKIPAFVSGVALAAAVVLVNLKPSTVYFNLNRPARGAAKQRRGLFAPPPPRGATTGAGDTARGSNPDRSRSKQRTSDAAVAKGADLARSRAKASKSRRTGG